MGKIKAHANLHNDNRIYLGAVAGMVMKENVKVFALKSGFYVIEPSGEEFIIFRTGSRLFSPGMVRGYHFAFFYFSLFVMVQAVP